MLTSQDNHTFHINIKENQNTFRQYFLKNRDEIQSENLVNMQIICIIGSLITIVLLSITPLIITGWRMTWEYYLLLPIQLFFFMAASWCRFTSRRISSFLVEFITASLFIALLSVLIHVSIFPYPSTPQIFLSIIFFLMPTLMIQRPAITIIITIFSTCIFLILAYFYKTPDCFAQDSFNVIASVCFSFVTTAIIYRLRIRDYETKMRFHDLSVTDCQTGLINKVEFENQCIQYLDSKESQNHCALLIIDLDNFKLINDTYGHQCGDMLLLRFSNDLRNYFTEEALVGRFGGDEFCVLIKKEASYAHLEELLRSFQQSLAPVHYNKMIINYSCSIGVSFSSSTEIDYKAFFHAADFSLYDAKKQGKGGYKINSFDSLS